MSPKSAGLAKKAGYTNVRVLVEGEPAWAKAGYPIYASEKFIKTGNIVLIDLRSHEKSQEARIKGAVSIPFNTLGSRIDDIPRKAPVVFYSSDEEDAMKALEKLREEGFKKVSLVYGDLDKWLTTKGAYESGPVVTDITWKRKLGKGEVSVKDFQMALEGKKTDVVILDVRTNDEAAAGKFPSAVHIPLDELSNRAGELPKDKKIYVYCSTGARAEMASMQLKKDGLNASFLVADIECDEDGCEIEE